MMQADGSQRNNVNLLRDTLAIAAANPAPEHCVPAILEAMCVSSGATGAYYLLLTSEPPTLLTLGINPEDVSDADLHSELAKALPAEFVLNPNLPDGLNPQGQHWLVSSIYSGKQPVAIVWLVSDAPFELSEEIAAILNDLLNVLRLITQNRQTQIWTEKLGRNQREFLRIVSHDLRSPLTSMRGFADMLESQMAGELTERQAYFVGKILAGISQMTSLVDNIQDAGRYDPETGFYEIERSQCDLIDIVQRIVANHLVPAEKQELTVTVNASDDVPIISADANMLERAITNLVDNAIKYTPNGGKIEVGVKRHGNDVLVYVQDNGFGIRPEDQRRLFERHTRIRRQEHNRVKGSGLGLFIVRSVAQRHGGNAWVESEVGKGSTFYISIPLEGDNLVVRQTTEHDN